MPDKRAGRLLKKVSGVRSTGLGSSNKRSLPGANAYFELILNAVMSREGFFNSLLVTNRGAHDQVLAG